MTHLPIPRMQAVWAGVNCGVRSHPLPIEKPASPFLPCGHETVTKCLSAVTLVLCKMEVIKFSSLGPEHQWAWLARCTTYSRDPVSVVESDTRPSLAPQ